MPKYIVKHTYLAAVTEEFVIDVPDVLPDGEGIEWLLEYPYDWMQHHPELVKSRGFHKADALQRQTSHLDDDYHGEYFDIEEMNTLDEIVDALEDDD